VATSARWKDADGHAQEATEWTRCVAWGTLAEVCAQSVNKGARVYVAGRLHTVRWEDTQAGERHARVEIVLDDLILLDRPTPQDTQDVGEPQPSTPFTSS
jgi:single-strand DNA-binding protein